MNYADLLSPAKLTNELTLLVAILGLLPYIRRKSPVMGQCNRNSKGAPDV
jgi:hypothetical protein